MMAAEDYIPFDYTEDEDDMYLCAPCIRANSRRRRGGDETYLRRRKKADPEVLIARIRANKERADLNAGYESAMGETIDDLAAMAAADERVHDGP